MLDEIIKSINDSIERLNDAKQLIQEGNTGLALCALDRASVETGVAINKLRDT